MFNNAKDGSRAVKWQRSAKDFDRPQYAVDSEATQGVKESARLGGRRAGDARSAPPVRSLLPIIAASRDYDAALASNLTGLSIGDWFESVSSAASALR